MREIALFVGLPIAVISICWTLAVSWPVAPPITPDPMPEYAIGGQQNKKNTGSVLFWQMVRQDEIYLFVSDDKRKPGQPILLCYLNYTSTQGSFNPKRSKDGQMVGVYNESSERGWGEPWVTGYDWKTGKVLQSKEIARAFSLHKGVGDSCTPGGGRYPTTEEIKQFKPERFHR